MPEHIYIIVRGITWGQRHLEGLGDGCFHFYSNLEAEKFAPDGTLLYVVSRDGAAMAP